MYSPYSIWQMLVNVYWCYCLYQHHHHLRHHHYVLEYAFRTGNQKSRFLFSSCPSSTMQLWGNPLGLFALVPQRNWSRLPLSCDTTDQVG